MESEVKVEIKTIAISEIRPNEYNPKKLSAKEFEDLKKSLQKFGIVDPLILNKAKGRENVLIGGHQRLKVLREMGIKEVPVVYVDIPDIEKEKELCLRLSKNVGEWDWDLLENFDKDFLEDVGFEKRDTDFIFAEEPETIFGNYELSHNPNDIYGGKMCPIRIGNLLTYIKSEDLSNYAYDLTNRINAELGDSQENMAERSKIGENIIKVIKENESFILGKNEE